MQEIINSLDFQVHFTGGFLLYIICFSISKKDILFSYSLTMFVFLIVEYYQMKYEFQIFDWYDIGYSLIGVLIGIIITFKKRRII